MSELQQKTLPFPLGCQTAAAEPVPKLSSADPCAQESSAQHEWDRRCSRAPASPGWDWGRERVREGEEEVGDRTAPLSGEFALHQLVRRTTAWRAWVAALDPFQSVVPSVFLPLVPLLKIINDRIRAVLTESDSLIDFRHKDAPVLLDSLYPSPYNACRVVCVFASVVFIFFVLVKRANYCACVISAGMRVQV